MIAPISNNLASALDEVLSSHHLHPSAASPSSAPVVDLTLAVADAFVPARVSSGAAAPAKCAWSAASCWLNCDADACCCIACTVNGASVGDDTASVGACVGVFVGASSPDGALCAGGSSAAGTGHGHDDSDDSHDHEEHEGECTESCSRSQPGDALVGLKQLEAHGALFQDLVKRINLSAPSEMETSAATDSQARLNISPVRE